MIITCTSCSCFSIVACQPVSNLSITLLIKKISILIVFFSRYSYETLVETANFLLSRTSVRPRIGVICGSGMGSYWKEGTYYFELFSFVIATRQLTNNLFHQINCPGIEHLLRVFDDANLLWELIFSTYLDICFVCNLWTKIVIMSYSQDLYTFSLLSFWQDSGSYYRKFMFLFICLQVL